MGRVIRHQTGSEMNDQNKTDFAFDRYTSRPLAGTYAEPAREIPILGAGDVLVVGGSQSGCAAAICAALLWPLAAVAAAPRDAVRNLPQISHRSTFDVLAEDKPDFQHL